MASKRDWNDEHLLAKLAAALAPPDVPPGVLDAAKAVYTWRTVDSELAELTYDSADATETFLGVRGTTASLRTLTYVAGEVALEIDITKEALVGQVMPPGSGQLLVLACDGECRTVLVEDAGNFRVHPIPRCPFRLSFLTAAGSRLTTGELPL
ncbi:MAG: hypothetical protein ACOYBY_07165 [Dermatophilaceae bacterium]